MILLRRTVGRRAGVLDFPRRALVRPLSTPTVPQDAAGAASDLRATPAQTSEAWLYIDSVFPVRLGSWDLRHYVGIFREDNLIAKLKTILSSIDTHGFKVLSIEPHLKDGGVFVRFRYNGLENAETLDAIENVLRDTASRQGGVPSWTGFSRGDVWLVKGQPWREDMRRYASPIVSVTFEGPDIPEEHLYKIFRPCGRIQDLRNPTPVPAGSLRSSTIVFPHLRSATIARNIIHGLRLPSSNPNGPVTRLRILYEQPIKAHAIRDWIASHPRFVLPVIVFLLGTLTYTIFDPVRAFMVEGKVMDWFDYREFKLYKWIRQNTVERFAIFSSRNGDDASAVENVWKERKDAEDAVNKYLNEVPTSIAFVYGPQGSGKDRLLARVTKATQRNFLVIDCTPLIKASSDAAAVSALADQTGYWPVFTFTNSINTMIDMASVGLIGQKAGLSTSLTDQVKQILEVVGSALKRVTTSHRDAFERRLKELRMEEDRKAQEARRRERIMNGTWHDPRLDCVAGNGVMSELGVGDENLDADTSEDLSRMVILPGDQLVEKEKGGSDRRQRSAEEVEALNSLPVVIIKNFASKGGRDDLLGVLAQWAATLAENQVAHVIVISDNRENAKTLARALPSKPLNTIALHDADAASVLAFVQQKLNDSGADLTFTAEQVSLLERLGGRASDLENLIHKVRSGQKVEEAVEDIISSGVGELRKNAFGDDVEDAKNLLWSREQAWLILKRLSEKEEIPYHDVLLEFPFKGDETAIRSMEHSELITVTTENGRPSMIRPGKPVYKYVFERVVRDPIFQATQDISFNEKQIASAESIVRACEEELLTLKQLGTDPNHWLESLGASSTRSAYLFKKMQAAEVKVEALEKKNAALKKVLSKGG
ncbi:hypothetical protein JAAARDRAFT_67035 [Jaapia argillacea MUCL 33604]|uniref:Mitochondrial escape protein 2 n=1 Tax=Jaapia argillacea MUCL 33604 TaxID=933084 RepID=A0A067QDB4_9AGAM|nr:hypothetical protein JAAARDRAFT_67035 [Jaapia argillacea MUCL 33604]